MKIKAKIWTALTLAAVFCLPQTAFALDRWQTDNPLVAHALGEADGKIETNSKEAFLSSWESGYRVVEGDFTYTSDGVLVLRHDFDMGGSYYRLEIESQGNPVMDYKTFKEKKAVYSQTPISAAELLSLMVDYPDMYLITDTKNTDQATVRRQFTDLKNIANNMGTPEVLQRIIPQIYHKDMLGWVRAVYPFEQWIYTLYMQTNPNYGEIAAFCAAQGIGTVTIEQLRVRKDVVDIFHAKNIKVYAHTVNRYKQMKDLLGMGVDGVYTDCIKPYELSWVGLQNARKIEDKTITVNGTEQTFPTLDIFGKAYTPLRQLAKVGKGFSANYDRESARLSLTAGQPFVSIGNELLMDNSGRLITKKADFRLFLNGTDTGVTCFLVDGEVFVPLEDMAALLQK